jgi:hypothetical protein
VWDAVECPHPPPPPPRAPAHVLSVPSRAASLPPSFSHITSLPSIVLPVAELAAVCKAHGVLVLIDGAHALGQLPVNVTALGVDAWLGNGHKWLFSPKGSAVLWVSPQLQVRACARACVCCVCFLGVPACECAHVCEHNSYALCSCVARRGTTCGCVCRCA